MPILVEACVGTVSSARTAESAGASRLELCSNLVEGGVTPSLGLVERVIAGVGIPVHVLIRPRGGDFLFDRDERAVMARDVALAKAAGARGVVIGALRPDGTIDPDITGELIAAARPMAVTFHRAYDLSSGTEAQRHGDTGAAEEALETLIALGVDRLLTSGQAANALEGAPTIAALVRRSAGRITIMAGGGVNETNVDQVIRGSGVQEIHVGASGVSESAMAFRRAGVFMGKAYQPNEYRLVETDPHRLARIVGLVNSER